MVNFSAQKRMLIIFILLLLPYLLYGLFYQGTVRWPLQVLEVGLYNESDLPFLSGAQTVQYLSNVLKFQASREKERSHSRMGRMMPSAQRLLIIVFTEG